jgi:hypothetical protein
VPDTPSKDGRTGAVGAGSQQGSGASDVAEPHGARQGVAGAIVRPAIGGPPTAIARNRAPRDARLDGRKLAPSATATTPFEV